MSVPHELRHCCETVYTTLHTDACPNRWLQQPTLPGMEVHVSTEPYPVIEDEVNHPAHYGGRDDYYEVIKVAEAWGLMHNAYLFTALRYLGRAGKKESLLVDLQKARWYLDRFIAVLETAHPDDSPLPGGPR